MKNDKPDDQREAERQNIERFVEETASRIECLNRLVETEPELLVPIARRQLVWPAFIGRKRAFQKQNAELIEKIQLGKDNAFSDGEWQPDASATRGAYSVYFWGSVMQKWSRLPKLKGKNKRKWFDKVWQCLIKKQHFIPELDALLRPLGEPAKKYDYKREDPRKRRPLAMRAEIKRQVWKAFDTHILPNK